MMSLRPGIRIISIFLLVFGVFAPRALADFGTCKAGWEWANNTLNQNPCQIAGALEAACEGFAVYVLGPIGQGTNYVTPQKNSSSQKCQCNTVMFSLYMACTGCQNVTTQPWTFWSQFCDEVFVTQYPQDIPAGAAVPNWAYLNYTVGDRFDPVAAKDAGGLPERLARVPATVSLSSTSSGSRPPSSTMTGSISTSTSEGRRSSNTGAIVGGIIGGLAALALIGVGVWILLRRRAVTRGDQSNPDYTRVSTSTGAPMSEHGHGKQPTQLKLYDPYDPSTFPTHVDYDPSAPYTTASVSYDGRYTGAAEL